MAEADDNRRSTLELRRMSEDEARRELTVVEYERWEQLQDLQEEAEETREQWREDEERVADIVVHADAEDLGTEVGVFGNTVVAHIDHEDDEFRDAAQAVEEEYSDVDAEDIDTLDDEEIQALGDSLAEMLRLSILKFNGTAFDELSREQQEDVVDECRKKWGVMGLGKAWMEIVGAIEEETDEKMGVVDRFRDPSRRGRR